MSWLKEYMDLLVPFAVKLKKKALAKDKLSGWTKCPKCQGRFDFRIAPNNHHIHGRCRTPDCIAFME